MMIDIKIKESQAQELIQFWTEKYKAMKQEIQKLEAEARELNSNIMQLKQSLKPPNQTTRGTPPSEYSEKWPWMRKIEFAISHSDNGMTTKEIVEALSEYDPIIESDKKRAISSVSSTLSVKFAEKFTKTERENKEFEYRLKEDDDDDLPDDDSPRTTAAEDFVNVKPIDDDDLPF